MFLCAVLPGAAHAEVFDKAPPVWSFWLLMGLLAFASFALARRSGSWLSVIPAGLFSLLFLSAVLAPVDPNIEAARFLELGPFILATDITSCFTPVVGAVLGVMSRPRKPERLGT